MPKIYHPDRGFVVTADQAIIAEILAEGGRIVKKNNEIDSPIDDLVESPIDDLVEPPTDDPVEPEVQPEPVKLRRRK